MHLNGGHTNQETLEHATGITHHTETRLLSSRLDGSPVPSLRAPLVAYQMPVHQSFGLSQRTSTWATEHFPTLAVRTQCPGEASAVAAEGVDQGPSGSAGRTRTIGHLRRAEERHAVSARRTCPAAQVLARGHRGFAAGGTGSSTAVAGGVACHGASALAVRCRRGIAGRPARERPT